MPPVPPRHGATAAPSLQPLDEGELRRRTSTATAIRRVADRDEWSCSSLTLHDVELSGAVDQTRTRTVPPGRAPSPSAHPPGPAGRLPSHPPPRARRNGLPPKTMPPPPRTRHALAATTVAVAAAAVVHGAVAAGRCRRRTFPSSGDAAARRHQVQGRVRVDDCVGAATASPRGAAVELSARRIACKMKGWARHAISPMPSPRGRGRAARHVEGDRRAGGDARRQDEGMLRSTSGRPGAGDRRAAEGAKF